MMPGKQTILVTGAAGFIGSYVAARLAALGHRVCGCDNFNDYYDPALKAARVKALLAPFEVQCRTSELADPAQVAALMAHAYSHLYRLPATGVRLFSVYGPWGRPDMAYFRFTKNCCAASRSRCSPAACYGATSPTSTTSSKAWRGCCSSRAPSRARRHTGWSTSAPSGR